LIESVSKKSTSRWYDEFHPQHTSTELSPWYEATLNLIGESNPSSSLLEVGCGGGNLLCVLKNRWKIGCDISRRAVRIASRYAEGVLLSDGESLPFRNNAFDVVVCCETIEHIRDADKLIGELARVSAKTGFLILSFPNYLNLPWLALRVLADLLKRPTLIVRQPIDRILFYPQVECMLARHRLKIIQCEGRVYSPPVLYRSKPFRTLDKKLESYRISFVAFHPVLRLEKCET